MTIGGVPPNGIILTLCVYIYSFGYRIICFGYGIICWPYILYIYTHIIYIYGIWLFFWSSSPGSRPQGPWWLPDHTQRAKAAEAARAESLGSKASKNMEKMGSFCDFNQEKLGFSRIFSAKTRIFYDLTITKLGFSMILPAKTGFSLILAIVL